MIFVYYILTTKAHGRAAWYSSCGRTAILYSSISSHHMLLKNNGITSSFLYVFIQELPEVTRPVKVNTLMHFNPYWKWNWAPYWKWNSGSLCPLTFNLTADIFTDGYLFQTTLWCFSTKEAYIQYRQLWKNTCCGNTAYADKIGYIPSSEHHNGSIMQWNTNLRMQFAVIFHRICISEAHLINYKLLQVYILTFIGKTRQQTIIASITSLIKNQTAIS